MIRAVFFDYDGVLTLDKTGSLTTCRSLAEQTGLPLDVVRSAFKPHNEALNLGRTTHEAVWPAICRALGRDVPFSLLSIAFESTPMDDAVMALAKRLAARHRVGLITDNKRDRIEHLRVFQGLDAVFDPIVVSSIVGSGKEGPAIFRHALERAGLLPEEALFIDNTLDNLAPAAALGLHTLHFDDERRDVPALVAGLRRHGLLTD